VIDDDIFNETAQSVVDGVSVTRLDVRGKPEMVAILIECMARIDVISLNK